MNQLLVTVPDSASLADLPAPLAETLGLMQLNADAGWQMPGTQVVDGRRAVHLLTPVTPPTVDWLLSLVESQLPLGWELVAAQSMQGSTTVSYAEYDEQGSGIGDPIYAYLGVYKKVPADFSVFLEPILDTDGETLIPAPPGTSLHHFDGCDEWVWDGD